MKKELSYILIYSNILFIIIIIVQCCGSEDKHAFHPLNILDQAKADTILAEAISMVEKGSGEIDDLGKKIKIDTKYYLQKVKSSIYVLDSFHQRMSDSCHEASIQSYYVLFYYPLRGLPPVKNIGDIFCLKVEKDVSKNTVNSILIFETSTGTLEYHNKLKYYRKLFWKVINGKKLPKQDPIKSSLKINERYIE